MIDADTAVIPEDRGNHVVRVTCSASRSHDVNIVKVRDREIAVLEPGVYFRKCWAEREAEKRGHKGIALFTALGLMDRVAVAPIIHPLELGRGAIPKPREWQELPELRVLP